MARPDEPDPITRLERFCAALYRAVPLEGHGVVGLAAELAHAAELEVDAAARATEREPHGPPALTARDVQAACQLLIDVRRQPNALLPEEVTLAREHFPEVEAPTLEPLEQLIGFYTSLLRGEQDEQH
jgi:hypothetical protein